MLGNRTAMAISLGISVGYKKAFVVVNAHWSCAMPKPVCFMLTPYGRKATQVEPSSNAPGEIDFNALWDRAFAPTIIALGYEPVRADQDTGALIINQMLERLYFADLVLADMTIPSGNIFYEVGLRHAMKDKGCVLLAADWSRSLFDIAQMRTVRYPLPEGNIVEATAKAIALAIKEPIARAARGSSPVYESLKGYPNEVDGAAASTMRDVMTATAAFQGEIRMVRASRPAGRMTRAKDLVTKYWKPPVTPVTALSLLRLMSDCAENADDWNWITDLIRKQPGDIAELEEVREALALATSNAGETPEAIQILEGLITRSGPTPRRLQCRFPSRTDPGFPLRTDPA
jgi:hypothetical protein